MDKRIFEKSRERILQFVWTRLDLAGLSPGPQSPKSAKFSSIHRFKQSKSFGPILFPTIMSKFEAVLIFFLKIRETEAHFYNNE